MKILITILITCTIPTYARVLSLDNAKELAVKNSETGQMAANNVLTMDEKVREFRGAALPNIDTTITYAYYPVIPDTVIAIPGMRPIAIPAKKDYESSVSTTITQVLWSFGKISTAIELAEKGKKSSRIGEKISKEETIFQTELAYYTALFAEEVYKITESSFDNAQKNRTITKQRYAGGKIPQGQQIKIEADVASRVASKEDAKSAYKRSLQYIKRLTGIEEEEITLEPISAQEEVIEKRSLREDEPRLKVLEEKIAISGDLITINKASHLPTLVAFANHTYTIDGDKASIGRENEKNIAAIGVKLNIPLFHGGSTEAVYQSSLLEKNNALLEQEKTKRDLELQLKNTITDYETALTTYNAGLESVKLAERNYLFSRERYASANVALSEVNDLELALTGQKINLAKSKFNLLQSKALINRLTKEGAL